MRRCNHGKMFERSKSTNVAFFSSKSLDEADVLGTDREEKVQDISGKPWYGERRGRKESDKRWREHREGVPRSSHYPGSF